MTFTYRAIILGCGASAGVPRIGDNWGECDPSCDKNYRTRSSLLLEKRALLNPNEPDANADKNLTTRLLIDTSPDIRFQLLREKVGVVDGVFYTHDHADQTHGIDDVRTVFFNRNKKRLPVWLSKETADTLMPKFLYCFDQKITSCYTIIFNPIILSSFYNTMLSLDGEGGTIFFDTFLQNHGYIHSLGFLSHGLAYSPDVSDMPEKSLELIRKYAQCWIVDCNSYAKSYAHANVDLVLRWFKETGVPRGILTNMSICLDYRNLASKLPLHIEPAFDGMVIEWDELSEIR